MSIPQTKQEVKERHRQQRRAEAGVSPVTREYEGADPLGFVISLNLHRRHLDESQRAIVAAKIAKLPRGSNQHASNEAPSQSQAADLLNVSRAGVQRAREVLDHGAPELVQAVERGMVSVSAAADVAELPVREQAQIVACGEKEAAKTSGAPSYSVRGAATTG